MSVSSRYLIKGQRIASIASLNSALVGRKSYRSVFQERAVLSSGQASSLVLVDMIVSAL